MSDNRNNSIIKKNVAAAFAIKGLSLCISLLTMPSYISYFNDQAVLGVWFTLLSILNWVLSFDLGMGNGLRNHLAIAIAANDKREQKTLISSAYLSNGVLSLMFALIGFLALPHFDWGLILGVDGGLLKPDAIRLAVTSVYLAVVLQLFLRLASFIAYALQMSFMNNLISLITNSLLLVSVHFLPADIDVSLKLTNLAVCYFVLVNLPLVILSIGLFSFSMKGMLPSPKFVKLSSMKKVTSLGGVFFFAQIEYMVLINTNEFFISTFISPEAVVEYQEYYRIFSLVGTAISLSMSPIWSVVTKTYAERDYSYLRSLYKKLKLLGLSALPLSIITAVMLPFIFSIWLGSQAPIITTDSLVVFIIFGAAFAYQSVLSTFACGMSSMRTQVICYLFGCIFKVLVLVTVLPIYPMWQLVVLTTAICLVGYCAMQQYVINGAMKLLDE